MAEDDLIGVQAAEIEQAAARPQGYPPGHGEVDLFDKLAVRYSGEGWIRGLVVALPVVGSALDAIVGTYGGGLIQQRQEYMLRDLDRRVGVLEEVGAGHRDFFRTEEGVDLLMAALVASGRTRHREKLRLYAAILAGAAARRRPDGIESEAMLASLVDLTPVEVDMLRVIHENRHQGWDASVAAFSDEARANLALHQGRLMAAGFIGTIHEGRYGGGVDITAATDALAALMALAPTLGKDDILSAAQQA